MDKILETRKKSVQKAYRISYLDIAKGIGIILVVWAHARGPCMSYMYQMHMPFFFLISGLLYHPDSSRKEYFVRKVKSLYIPFAFWNVLFFTAKSILHGASASYIAKTVVGILLTLSKDGQFFGATWFLGSLFVISVLYKMIDFSLKDSAYADVLMLLLFGIFALISFQITFPYMVSRTFICGMYFAGGAFIKKHWQVFRKIDHKILPMICGILFLVIGHYNSANMGSNEYRYPVLFVIGAAMASYSLICFCRYFDRRTGWFLLPLKHLLIFLGRNSMDIVIWQFVAFRAVIMVQMYLNHETITISNILKYYPCYSTEGIWWLAYTAAGLLLPLLFCSILRTGVWGKWLKFLHIV